MSDHLFEVAKDLLARSRNWGGYPQPHYDLDDTCMCPDHVAMRRARDDDNDDD